jgi:hypothetical protein
MKNKYYTAEPREDAQILIYMPGWGYHLELDEARKLRDSLNSAIREAEIQDAIKNDDGDRRGVVFRDNPDY